MIQERKVSVTMIQLHTALIGLRFEARTGMKVSRHVSAYQWTKNLFGYPPKSRPNKEMLVRALEGLISDIETSKGMSSDMEVV